MRIFIFSKGIPHTHSLPCKVVSIGNITMGGTGKTPFVCMLAKMIQAKGIRGAVLSRGYKGKFKGPFALVHDGEKFLMNSRQAGDEPYLLAENLKGIPVVVGKKRWQSGEYVYDKFGSEILILDDGYQHLPLKRDLNLLLIDSTSPFGNGYLFPRGALREPPEQISRADAIILTKVGQSDNIKNLKKILLNFTGKVPLFQADYRPGKIRIHGDKRSLKVDQLNGEKILAFCGLASPESFIATLLNLHAQIAEVKTFRDHHWYSKKDMQELFTKADKLGVDALVTTEKDFVRLSEIDPGSIPLWALTIEHFFPGEEQAGFEEFLFSRLDLGG